MNIAVLFKNTSVRFISHVDDMTTEEWDVLTWGIVLDPTYD